MTLNDQVVLITGATGGLGHSVTTAFLQAGAQVAGVSRKIQAGDFANPAFHAFPGELGSADAAQAVAGAVIGKLGRIDTVVHLVGAFAGGQPFADTGDDTLERMLDLNFRSAFWIARAVLPGMRQRGSGAILAIGSRVATEPVATLGAYAASKAALVSLMRTLALENRDRGIRANVVLPGTMDTPANRQAMPDADSSQWVDPAQVAALLVHLASPQASQITGAVIPVLGREL
jgi:NAD(P)-dependent dehydrogenase (short-subunit alcohol dehydrogenase family)